MSQNLNPKGSARAFSQLAPFYSGKTEIQAAAGLVQADMNSTLSCCEPGFTETYVCSHLSQGLCVSISVTLLVHQKDWLISTFLNNINYEILPSPFLELIIDFYSLMCCVACGNYKQITELYFLKENVLHTSWKPDGAGKIHLARIFQTQQHSWT